MKRDTTHVMGVNIESPRTNRIKWTLVNILAYNGWLIALVVCFLMLIGLAYASSHGKSERFVEKPYMEAAR